ncbi:MAG: hypothetical protein APF84_14805 [Gracilibacter sp. BRH_c7a]|nr:MAG: hypothetical protein APF84_14805 [Gracilibacter sp. BRH_c7a]
MSFRVNNSDQTQSLAITPQSLTEKREANFSNILAQTRQLESTELQLFLNKLEKQGKKLAQSLSLQDLVEFKKMVKSFLKSTLGQARNMQEETLWDYRGQPKVMARVTKINRALEELGEQVLSSQAEPLKILTKIDEIKGLILDLLA